MSARYLPAEAIRFGIKFFHRHETHALLGSLLLWSGLTFFFRWRFRRWGLDVAVFALAMTVVLLFISACLYILSTRPGYHFIGNL